MELVWVFTVCVSLVLTNAQSCTKYDICTIQRVWSMKAADCYNKDMKTVPQCLPSDVEIADFSHNRIRRITYKDMKKYTNLKILYLSDNLVTVIADDAFEGKDHLHTLDLSLNAIIKLPHEVFNLPSLQTLYLGQNLNINIVEIVEKAKPIASPLYHLDISFLTEADEDTVNILPDFGLLPRLEKYNISGNKQLSILTKYFAGLCSLKILDTSNVTVEYEESDDRCECWIVNRWLTSRNVSFKTFPCKIDESECPNGRPPDEDLRLFEECIQEVNNNIRKSRLKTILMIAIPCVGAVLLIAAALYYCRVKKRRRREPAKDRTRDLMLNNANYPNNT